MRSYEEQWTEEEFERLCQAESPGSPTMKDEFTGKTLSMATNSTVTLMQSSQHPTVEPLALPKLEAMPSQPLSLENKEAVTPQPLAQQHKELAMPQPLTLVATPPSKRGRGRPRRVVTTASPPPPVLPSCVKAEESSKVETTHVSVGSGPDILANTSDVNITEGDMKELQSSTSMPIIPPCVSPPSSGRGRGRGRKQLLTSGGEAPAPRRRGKRASQAITSSPSVAIGIQGEVGSATTSSVTLIAKDVCVEPKSVSPAPVPPPASVQRIPL